MSRPALFFCQIFSRTFPPCWLFLLENLQAHRRQGDLSSFSLSLSEGGGAIGKLLLTQKKKTYTWDIFNHICHLILSYKESGQFIEYVDDKRKICMENIHSFKGRKNLSRLLRYVLNQKKRYYLGIFPKRRTPPTPPTPTFWEPLIQKKILVFILHFRT